MTDGWLIGVVAAQELDLKVRQFNTLLRGRPALSEAPNVNMLWAHLMVDELCRLGSSTFCIAPGQSACTGHLLVINAHAETPKSLDQGLTSGGSAACWVDRRCLMRRLHALHRVQIIPADSGCSCAPSRKDCALHRRALPGVLGTGLWAGQWVSPPPLL